MDWFNKVISEKMLIGLVALVAVGISFIYLGKTSTESAQNVQTKTTVPAAATSSSKIQILEKEMEDKLQAKILLMQGVGKVSVTVSFATGLKTEYARDANTTKSTTKETDKAGSTRETTAVTDNSEVVMVSGTSQPVTVVEDRPEIAGVWVIAQGANDPLVREEIHKSLQTLLNIPSAKISVVPMGGT